MSYDLFLFRSDTVQTDKSAAALYDAFFVSEDPSGPLVTAFLEQFLEAARQKEGIGSDEPWPGEFEASGDSLRLHLVAGAHPDVTELVLTLAEKHGLYLFDPQMGELISGPENRCSDDGSDQAADNDLWRLIIRAVLVTLVSSIGFWVYLLSGASR